MDSESKEILKKIEKHLKALAYFQGKRLSAQYAKDRAVEKQSPDTKYADTSGYKSEELLKRFMSEAYHLKSFVSR